MIKIKLIYPEPTDDDGFRILVDRLWPRGLTKQKANVALWLKNIAPSTERRKWFGHDLNKWEQFFFKYSLELEQNKELLNFIIKKGMRETVTLIHCSKDEAHNEAVILKAKADKNV